METKHTYCKTYLITGSKHDEFHEKITETIFKIQNEGYYAEIQYQPNTSFHSALVLAYK